MRVLAIVLALSAGAAQAGTLTYKTCMTDEAEARATARFVERFPHETCAPFEACPFKLRQTVLALVERDCRAEALAGCADESCLRGLRDRWSDEATRLREAIDERLEEIDLGRLPRLQRRRLSDPARWFSPAPCTEDTLRCEAEAAGQLVGDLRRIQSEIGQLE